MEAVNVPHRTLHADVGNILRKKEFSFAEMALKGQSSKW